MRAGHPEHLGKTVKARRQQLNLTLDGIKAAGGPTGPTVIRAEAGQLTDPRPSTLAKLDAALRWTSGSAAHVYWDQGSPQQVHSAVTAPLRTGSATVELPLELVLKLLTSQRTLNDVADHTSMAALESVREDLNAHVSAIAGLFVTDLLERNYTGGGTAAHPLLEYAFGELLADPPAGPAKDEQLYRRWLLGKTDGVTPADARRFTARLQQRGFATGAADA